MTADHPPDADDPPAANRRDLLKGALLGGIADVESRRQAVSALLPELFGRREPTPTRSAPASTMSGSHADGPVPVRATGSVSIREIARNTATVSGPPYKLSEVATERHILRFSHGTNPRYEPPFAFRELITSQKIRNQQITLKRRGRASWMNWVRDHGSGNLTKFKPDSVQDLLDALLWNAREEKQIRAVGSGHSHSKVAAPDQSFFQLSWYTDKQNNRNLAGLIDERNHRWLDPGVSTTDLVRVEAGATIKYLNRHLLLKDGKALPNMGSFDAQTLAGAINTSTHGTGAGLGSVADLVKSVELMTVEASPAQPDRPIVRKYRIEPGSDPITDRRRFEDDVGTHGTTLIQNDDVFHSVVVGYGVMGVAHSYTIQVRDKFFLHEHNRHQHWDSFKHDISTLIDRPSPHQPFSEVVDSANQPTGARHFQFRVNLPQVELANKDRRNPKCLLISHREPSYYDSATPNHSSSYPAWPSAPYNWNKSYWPPERRRKSMQRFFRNLRKSGHVGFKPKKTPAMLPPGINWRFGISQNKPAFEGVRTGNLSTPTTPDRDMSASYIALRRKVESRRDPEAEPEPPPGAISTEIAVPANQVQTAVEAVIEAVIDSEYAYNIPMGVRFVKRSPHFLSPEYSSAHGGNPQPVAKVEVPFFVRKFMKTTVLGKRKVVISRQEQLAHADKALEAIEDKLIGLANQGRLDFARPHMGKTNHLSNQQLKDFYDRFDTWQAVHERFDGFGTFNNGFTNDKGIDIPRP